MGALRFYIGRLQSLPCLLRRGALLWFLACSYLLGPFMLRVACPFLIVNISMDFVLAALVAMRAACTYFPRTLAFA